MAANNSKLIISLSALGAGLEYYDFVIYGMMAQYLHKVFFLGVESAVWTFLILAVGYIFRPLGGIIFGVLADKLGRKKTFATIMFIMAFATLGIGLIPSAHEIGGVAVILLVLCRILQGISFGAELPGAITVVSEFTERKVVGVSSSLIISGTSVGALLAALVLTLLTSNYTDAEILAGVWRIPFLFGGILAIISYVIRLKISETPEFIAVNFQHGKAFFAPLLELFSRHARATFIGAAFNLFTAALLVTTIYFPSYFHGYFAHPAKEVFKGVAISLLWAAVFVPIAGLVTDRLKRQQIFIFTCVLFLGLGSCFIHLWSLAGFETMLAFFLFYQVLIGLSIMCSLPLIVSLFPTHVRFTGVAFCYNLSYFFASFLPSLYTYLGQKFNSPALMFYILDAIALFSLISSIFFRVRNKY